MVKNIKSLVGLMVVLLVVLAAFLILRSTISADSKSQKPGKLYGTLIDSKTKKAIVNSKVEIKALSTGAIINTPVTKKGTYSIKIAPGSYTVKATASGYLNASANAVVKAKKDTKANVILAKEQAGSIQGSVSYSNSQSIIISQIQIYQVSKANIYNIYPVNGKFSIGSLKPGLYDVKAITFNPKQQQVKHSINVIDGKATVANFIFKKEELGSISGKVTWANGSPHPYSNVDIYQGPGSKVQRIVTDANGNFTIQNLKAGIYDVKAKSYQVQSKTEHGVRVNSGVSTKVNFVFKKDQGGLSGSVKWDDNSVINGSMVEIWQQGNPVGTYKKFYVSNGLYEFDYLASGYYDVKVSTNSSVRQSKIEHGVYVDGEKSSDNIVTKDFVFKK